VRTIALVAYGLLVCMSVNGEDSGKLSITGNVADTQGAIVSIAKVELFRADNQLIGSGGTNSDGNFEFINLIPGDYRLRVSAPKFDPIERNIRLHSSARVQITLTSGMSYDESFAVYSDELKKLAGPAARNCGHSRSSKKPKGATRCAVKAFHSKRPFFISYEDPCIDATCFVGAAYTAEGKLFVVDMVVDSNDNGPRIVDEHTRKEFLERHQTIVECPSPSTMSSTEDGRFEWSPLCSSNLRERP
jgi:hypothetical protein